MSEEKPDEIESPPTFGRRVRGWVWDTVWVVTVAVVIASLVRLFIAQMFLIPSGSMENTLLVNDRVAVKKFGGFERGDVVVFEDPGGWLSHAPKERGPVIQALEFVGVLPNSSTEYLIKRVIGMPGDRVRVNEQGFVEVNGQALDESAYLYSEQGVQIAPSTVVFDVVVPAGHVFVLGDHRNASSDSRCKLTNVRQGDPPGMTAFVPVEKVVGASVAIVAPLDRMATFRVPEAFKEVPAPAEPAPEKPVLNHVEPCR
ncbi:signal peptidase I [Tessaracoccus sp. OH4464_COT-324]|uniref:signal peptidase I n=1 Tax=Tessaracoccus sp. OH4464_COT-324 TaxID=2491059 RepID=UPI001F2BE612|nr:signal peptidase I [Tessaracoccus sp. OH4464_COT-324]